MKITIISSKVAELFQRMLQAKITELEENKKEIIDIKFACAGKEYMKALVMYKESE